MADLSQIAFIDCETTGVDPTRHVPWEIAVIVDEQEYSWRLILTEPELAAADPMALKIGGWYARRGDVYLSPPEGDQSAELDVTGVVSYYERQALACSLAGLIGERHLVGAVPKFDDRFVGDFCRRWVRPPIWHYHLVDIEAMMVGWLAAQSKPWQRKHGLPAGVPLPWKSNDLSRILGIDPAEYGRHNALEDCRWVRALYLRMMDG